MSTSEFDAYFPQEYAGPRRRRRGGDRSGSGGSRGTDWLTGRGRGRGEQPVVPEPEFTSYYGHSVVKPVPWRHEISIYLFTGGVAGGSGLLAAGAHAAGLPVLRRNARMTAIVAAGVSGVALIADLGRPERFLNMLRVFKPTSPLSVGSFILGIGMLPFIWNVIKSWRYGEIVTVDDPWGYGNSLEWATSCPPPRHNFTALPRIRSERPAFELHYPHMVEQLRREAHSNHKADTPATWKGTNSGK